MEDDVLTKQKVGRKPVPKEKRAEIINRVFEIMTQGVSLRKASIIEGYAHVTIMRWIDEEGFSEKYQIARDALLDYWSDQIMDIADAECDTSVQVNSNRLRIETRKWVMSKLSPKRFGDKVSISGDKDDPLNIQVSQAVTLSDEQLMKIAAMAQEKTED